MKKILITTVFLLVLGITLTQAQETTRTSSPEFNEFFYSWGLDVTTYTDSNRTLHIEDRESEDWSDLRNTLSTIMFAVADEADYLGVMITSLDFESLIYYWYDIDEFSVKLPKEWIVKYFETERDKDRDEIINELVKTLR
jgi:hypothetical protein